MELGYRFDPKFFRLGTLCKHGHRWPGTELGLRRKDGYECIGCIGDKKRDWLIRFIDSESLGLQDGWRLGRLCKRKHSWNNHQLTLRNKGGKCVECEKLAWKSEKKLEWRRVNKERLNILGRERESKIKRDYPEEWERRQQKRRDRMQKPEVRENIKKRKQEARDRLKAQGLTTRGTVPVNKDEAAVIRKELNQLYAAIRNAGKLSNVIDLVKQEQYAYWKEHPQARMEHARIKAKHRARLRQMTDLNYRLYNREKSKRRKAQLRGALAVQIPPAAIKRRFLEFGNRCAYCGSGKQEEMQIEHVIPISSGGPHDIGNIVPACHRCNMSKSNHVMESWYQAQPFFETERMRKILTLRKAPAGYQLDLVLA